MALNVTEEDLFSRYIDICNKALAENKDEFPFKQIFDAAKSSQLIKKTKVQIFDDLSEVTYVMQLDNDEILGQRHDACADCQCDGVWRVSTSYLNDVIENSNAHIENPAKIDWSWML